MTREWLITQFQNFLNYIQTLFVKKSTKIRYSYGRYDDFVDKLVTKNNKDGLSIETLVYIAEFDTYYTLQNRKNDSTDDNTILIENSNFRLLPNPYFNQGKISIRAFGGKPQSTNANDYVLSESNIANSQKLVKAINYAIANGYTIDVPVGKFYITEGITIPANKSLRIEGVTNYGIGGADSGQIGSNIIFVPASNNQTLFSDGGNKCYVSITKVGFMCPYTHFSRQSFSDPPQITGEGYRYYDWTFDYDDVNCLNLRNSILDISHVNITGFSGYGLSCANAHEIKSVTTVKCKYGFYECKTDTHFQEPFIQACQYGFYWDAGTVLFCYDLWCDQCEYGIYSKNELSGEITGTIDHCLYSAIYVGNSASTGLHIAGRMERCGMFYAGVDMLENLPATFTDEEFDRMSKGVTFAIKSGTGLSIDIIGGNRKISDNGTGTIKLPSLLLYGKRFYSATIRTSANLGEKTWKAFYPQDSHVSVYNCNSNYVTMSEVQAYITELLSQQNGDDAN